MPELDPTCVDWTIYEVNLRHLTLQYPVSNFIDICMVACTKKLFFMIYVLKTHTKVSLSIISFCLKVTGIVSEDFSHQKGALTTPTQS